MDINFFLPAAIVIVSTWLLVLSIVVYTFVLKVSKKSKIVKNQDHAELLEKHSGSLQALGQHLSETNSQLAELEEKSTEFVQKVGFVKFNPFAETGGDHSFSVALMDGHNDGFVITSLHTRAGTRTYAKLIRAGKSDQEFSKEEKKALEQALNNVAK